MATLSADPLAHTTRLLVDGTNLLHALSKSPSAAPRSALIGRLRGVVPDAVMIEVVFDGPAERGLRGERIAKGLLVRYGGPRTADAVLLSLVDEVRANEGPIGTAAILVVTDDRDLKHGLRFKGARTAGTAWLIGRLERTARGVGGGSGAGGGTTPRIAGSTIGTGRAPRTSTGHMDGTTPANDDEQDRPGWNPGRGATTKHGNPRRSPRRRTGC
jgi:predicted RNA-binding protein with PIN domain